jgi:hypothetical protein
MPDAAAVSCRAARPPIPQFLVHPLQSSGLIIHGEKNAVAAHRDVSTPGIGTYLDKRLRGNRRTTAA